MRWPWRAGRQQTVAGGGADQRQQRRRRRRRCATGACRQLLAQWQQPGGQMMGPKRRRRGCDGDHRHTRQQLPSAGRRSPQRACEIRCRWCRIYRPLGPIGRLWNPIAQSPPVSCSNWLPGAPSFPHSTLSSEKGSFKPEFARPEAIPGSVCLLCIACSLWRTHQPSVSWLDPLYDAGYQHV